MNLLRQSSLVVSEPAPHACHGRPVSGWGRQQNHTMLLLSLTHAHSLPRSRSRPHRARAKPSAIAIAVELRHARLLPPPHHHPLHLTHSSTIISSTSPNHLCHHPSSGEAAVRVCHRRSIAGAPSNSRSPWLCSTEPTHSLSSLVRVNIGSRHTHDAGR